MLWCSSVQLTNIQMLRYNRELGCDVITPKQETEMIGTLTRNLGSVGNTGGVKHGEKNNA